MKHIALAAALLVDGCGANAFDEIEKDKARIEEEHQEHLKQLLAEQKTWEEDALECRRRARDLPIGVSEDQLPCCRNDAHGDYIAYAHVNLTTTRAGSTSQWVYEGPNGRTAYLYFNELGKLVAKQSY